MRKILILAAVFCIAGCKIAGVTDGTHTIGSGYTKGIGYEFIYNGHQYIRFVGYDSWGVVHDPDCPCLGAAKQVRDTLDSWQKLQLAIIWTESKADPAAVGKDNDGGLYQMVPIYVAEVNRVCGTSYTHADVFDPDKAIEIFNAMQDAKNPGHDIETAIYFHNKSANYRRAVMENYELICRMEEVRAKLICK